MSEPHPRKLPPIPDEERVERPQTLSQTALAKFASCPRSYYLLLKYQGGPASHAMIRGSLFHAVVEELTNMLIINDEQTVPPEIAREVVTDVSAAHPEWVLPPHEFDAVRMMAFHWASHTTIDPETVFGVEQMWTMEIRGWTVRGKIDLLLASENMMTTRDYKTSKAMKSQEKWEEDFQSIFYDVVTAYGHTDDGQMIGNHIEMFESTVVYPRYVFDGRLASRESYRDRIDLRDHHAYMIDLVAKVEHALETHDFPAIKGDHCGECPASLDCPLLAIARDGAGEIRTVDDARRAAEDRMALQSEAKRLGKELRAWVSENGELQFGANKELYFRPEESKSVQWETLLPALERTVELGEPFDLEAHVKRSNSTKLAERTTTPASQLAG